MPDSLPARATLPAKATQLNSAIRRVRRAERLSGVPAGALRAALIYAIVGGAWIVFSDRAVEAFVTDPALRAAIQTWKGLFFVVASALIVGLLVYRELRRARGHEAIVSEVAELSGASLVVIRSGRVVEANDAALQLLGAGSIDELPEAAAGELLGARATPQARPGSKTDDPAGTTAGLHRITLTRVDGAALRVAVSLRRVEWEDEPAWVGVIFDVTESERRAGTERTRQRLEVLGQITATIAHDLRNLLTTILVPLEFALDRLEPDAPGRPDVEDALVGVGRAGRLTRQLLAFGSPRGGTVQPVDLRTFLEEVRPMLGHAVASGVEVVTEVAAGLPAVEIDPARLSQVVMNLALNAAEAMEHRGRVTIRAGAGGGKPPGVRIEVEDTGPGIDPAIARNLFEPFFTTKASGTGLGLVTVQRIVAEAGGSITFDPGFERGAHFVIELPASTRVPAAPAPTPTTVVAGATVPIVEGSPVVLVVEDEPQVRRAASRALERGGYRVVAAASCAEARALVREGVVPDLLVTDVGLPDGDGRDLARELVAERPDLAVVVMSGHASGGDAVGSGAPERTRFLEKPFTISDLRSVASAARSGHG
ncbi:MAG: ATP-binding protein [Longimicrobiales bacterium]|nr:ATP-binding protein [Longimicrobiales bacterium]